MKEEENWWGEEKREWESEMRWSGQLSPGLEAVNTYFQKKCLVKRNRLKCDFFVISWVRGQNGFFQENARGTRSRLPLVNGVNLWNPRVTQRDIPDTPRRFQACPRFTLTRPHRFPNLPSTVRQNHSTGPPVRGVYHPNHGTFPIRRSPRQVIPVPQNGRELVIPARKSPIRTSQPDDGSSVPEPSGIRRREVAPRRRWSQSATHPFQARAPARYVVLLPPSPPQRTSRAVTPSNQHPEY